MRLRLLTVLLALLWTGVGATARAQDQAAAGSEGASPESGDTAAMGTPMAPPPAENTAPAPSADAGGPKKPISASLLLGYGVGLQSGGNPWGLGFGLRGGYNLDKIYLGARFVYYLGKSVTVPNPFGTPVSVTANIWELGVEGGYDVDAAQGLVVRPLVGLGIANSGVSGTGISGASSTDLYIAPGAALLYDVSDSFFVGVDARLQLVFASSLGKSLIFLANGGMRF
jgi:hypothetical protein